MIVWYFVRSRTQPANFQKLLFFLMMLHVSEHQKIWFLMISMNLFATCFVIDCWWVWHRFWSPNLQLFNIILETRRSRPSPPNGCWGPGADLSWTLFLLLCLLARLLAHFGSILVALGSILATLGSMLATFDSIWVSSWFPFGSMLVHFARFWRPKTNPAPNDPRISYLNYLFRFF